MSTSSSVGGKHDNAEQQPLGTTEPLRLDLRTLFASRTENDTKRAMQSRHLMMIGKCPLSRTPPDRGGVYPTGQLLAGRSGRVFF